MSDLFLYYFNTSVFHIYMITHVFSIFPLQLILGILQYRCLPAHTLCVLIADTIRIIFLFIIAYCTIPHLPDYSPISYCFPHSSYLEYVKTGVFQYMFWVTLVIVFMAGTIRISLFCMGYLMGVFFFLWFGQEMLIKPLGKLLRL